MTRITTVLATVLSFMPFTPLAAQDLQKGGDAYNAGDYATALQEWTPLAEAGNVSAQYNLGVMYKNGQGVPQDYAEAVRLYRLAADQGDANAQKNLGDMYANGQGVLQDNAEAVRWYRLAVEAGHEEAQAYLGFMYWFGIGVPQDNVTAHMWFNIYSANGNDRGMRDSIAEGMTQQAVEKAQAMARECMSSGYQNCGY